MHATIERQKQRVLKSGPIYVPSQWPAIIRGAKKQGKPYIVKELATEEFFDFKKLSQEIGKNFSVNVKNDKVLWNDIQVIKVEQDNPTSFFYKTNFDDAFEQINVHQKQRGQPFNIKSCTLEKAFAKAPGISSKTKEHLAELCSKNIIKKVYHPFYNSLFTENC